MCEILILKMAHFTFTESLQGRDYYTHFIDRDCGSETFPRKLSWQDVEPGLKCVSV